MVAMSLIFPLCPGTLSPGSRTEGTISVQRDRYVKGLASFRALHKAGMAGIRTEAVQGSVGKENRGRMQSTLFAISGL